MIKNSFALVFILSIISLVSCKQSYIDLNSDPIVKTWVYSEFDEGLEAYIYIASHSLKNDAPGFIFRGDGSLTTRRNSGWCGTPPISYTNYKGTWKYTSDTTLWLSTQFWGTSGGAGNLEYNFKIIELFRGRYSSI